MKHSFKLKPYSLLPLLAVLTACGGGSGTEDSSATGSQVDTQATVSAASNTIVNADGTTDGKGGVVLYSETRTLREGEATSGYSLLSGSYITEVTSTGVGDGVKVDWVGATCPTASETTYYRNLCVVPAGGSTLVISNPSTEWKGDQTVTVLLKRMRDTATNLVDGFVVANETQTLIEGATRSFTFNAGDYEADVSSGQNGVKVVWNGTKCPSYNESVNYKNPCTVAAGGKITISNPDAEYKGAEVTKIVIRKVATSVIPAGTVVINETASITEEGSRTFLLGSGIFRAQLSGITNGVNISWSKTACSSGINVAGGTYPCSLPSGGTLTVTNPSIPWWIGAENVKIKVTKTKL